MPPCELIPALLSIIGALQSAPQAPSTGPQQPTRDRPGVTASSAHGTIRGRVTDFNTAEGLPRALVRLSGVVSVATHTRPTAASSLTSSLRVLLFIDVTRAGYLDDRGYARAGHHVFNPIALGPDWTDADVAVQLIRSSVPHRQTTSTRTSWKPFVHPRPSYPWATARRRTSTCERSRSERPCAIPAGWPQMPISPGPLEHRRPQHVRDADSAAPQWTAAALSTHTWMCPLPSTATSCSSTWTAPSWTPRRWSNGFGAAGPQSTASILPRLLQISHGRPTIETLTIVAPHLATAEEAARLDNEESDEPDGLAPVQGAPELIASLPADRWGVVTSAGRRLAVSRLTAAGLPVPRVLVTSDDVDRGKPDPRVVPRSGPAVRGDRDRHRGLRGHLRRCRRWPRRRGDGDWRHHDLPDTRRLRLLGAGPAGDPARHGQRAHPARRRQFGPVVGLIASRGDQSHPVRRLCRYRSSARLGRIRANPEARAVCALARKAAQPTTGVRPLLRQLVSPCPSSAWSPS